MSTYSEKIRVENYDQLTVGHWMTPYPHTIRLGSTYREAIETMEELDISALPVIDEQGDPVGFVTRKQVIRTLLNGTSHDQITQNNRSRNFLLIQHTMNILDLYHIPHDQFLVVDEKQKLVGVITKRDILDAFSKHIYHLKQTENKVEVLSVILEKAYEGIAVVDQHGILLEFNEAYSRFTGVKREDAIGRHVTEVIENTNLHITVKTGVPDRGVLQIIQGQPMVVHRIPLWKDQEIIGAIGMLIFEGVSEVYDIYDKLQRTKLANSAESGKIEMKASNDNRGTLENIIGTSESILAVKRIARKAARTVATVLISGESGTGKEIFAQSIHHLSPYFNGPFVSVNCGAIPDHLFESELFGYESGAFTGAKKDGKLGKFELAHNGTIFLDEIGELSLPMQTKLLRVLQEREVERVGGVKKYQVNVRVIAATNRDLEQMVEEGKFREDLYYRLNIIRLHLPPLRERKEDIPILLSSFLQRICDKYNMPHRQFSKNAVALLMDYQWKGNIRELVNIVEHATIMTDKEVIEVQDLPILQKEETVFESAPPPASVNQFKTIGETAEKQLIVQILQQVNGNKSKAAELLGIHRTTLYQKLRKYELH